MLPIALIASTIEIPQRAEEVSALEIHAVRYDRLLNLYSKYSTVKNSLDTVQEVINKTQHVEQATLCLNFIDEVMSKVKHLQSLRDVYKNNENKLKTLREQIIS